MGYNLVDGTFKALVKGSYLAFHEVPYLAAFLALIDQEEDSSLEPFLELHDLVEDSLVEDSSVKDKFAEDNLVEDILEAHQLVTQDRTFKVVLEYLLDEHLAFPLVVVLKGSLELLVVDIILTFLIINYKLNNWDNEIKNIDV